MTALKKVVKRRAYLDPRLGPKAAGEITVALYPDSTIGFRKLKSRKEVRLTLAGVYSLALKAEARKIIEEKKAAKKVRRKSR